MIEVAPDRIEWIFLHDVAFGAVWHFGRDVARIRAEITAIPALEVVGCKSGYRIDIVSHSDENMRGWNGRIILSTLPEIAEACGLARQWTELCAA